MNYRIFLSVFLIFLITCTLPAMAVNTYVGANPVMSATISGANEFTPGEDADITVVILNSGTSDMKQVMQGTIDRDDLPTTAKMVNVSLVAGSAPVIIKSDPMNVGDIASKASKTATIKAKITNNATEGEYTLPLTIGYTYLKNADQVAADVLQNNYVTTSVTVPLTIKIKPQVKIEVLEATAENLNVGTSGFITLKIKNLGFEDGKKATVTLKRNGKSPIIPTDSNVFIGDFPSNGIVTCRYKVSISNEAGKQMYPVDVVVTYENREGDVVTSAAETLGIPVGGKVTFAVMPESAAVAPGSGQVLVIRYQNTGEIPVYSAQARLSAVGPFTSGDSTAFLGDLKPGETALARYTVSVADDAEVKEYALDTEVRYRDSLDNSQVSDTTKVPVQVVAKPVSSGIFTMLPVLVIVVLVALGAGYYLLVMRKKK